ncbi:nucleoside phosphorylase [Caldisericum exile]|uniref:Uridine phosphorylase n=1 Tax=Caldisericum exile (strain DSM 21853 / NBRC 104410 / AZM16c01) TaxID=511051 RepID=A0A7U6GEJ2_CALEA|nr:nucleoside phosphorylase [Caldisericum exile]BAL80955.1 putative uridine phosphorylase [Caldisericum exile AZM16c01]
MAQFHIRCESEDISPYVILVGNPQRAEKMSKLLDNAKLVNEYRLLYVYTGLYKGERITIATTGMGAPSTAIVLEELINLGGKVFIRVGSAGGIDPQLNVGDVVIATGSIRDDGTTPNYLRPTFPAIADFDVTKTLIDVGKETKSNITYGVVISQDAFYVPYPDEEMEKFVKAKVKAVEMESGCVFIVSQYRGVRAGALFALDGNVYLKKMKPFDAEELFKRAEEDAINIGLEAIYRLSKAGLK